MDFGDILDKIGGGEGALAGIGALAGGLGLLDGDQKNVGYQGKVPRYTAVRGRVPYESMDPAGRRPGQAGRRYFTDTFYAAPEEGAGLPTLSQAKQQVEDQTQAILNKEQYTPPEYEKAPTAQSSPGPSQGEKFGLAMLLKWLGEQKSAGSGTTPPSGGPSPAPSNGPTPGVDNTGKLVAGYGDVPDVGPPSKLTSKTSSTPVWHYNASGELVREVPKGRLYQVDVGGGHMDSFVSEEAAKARAEELYGSNYATGGLATLPKSNGYYLGGMTDGMADKVPASIDGEQEAALSDGEFVVPADVVSHLGNGNSNAGAKQLFDMMDRIRQARTGNKQQGKQIRPDKILPV